MCLVKSGGKYVVFFHGTSKVFVSVFSPDIDVSLDSQMLLESTGQQRDDASLPSTSQDPGNLLRSISL